METRVTPKPLTPAAFAEFGDVVELDNAKNRFSMNEGKLERFYDLASIDIGAESGGRPVMSIAQSKQTTSLPLNIDMLERHPLASQLIYPLFSEPMIVLVAPKGEEILPAEIKAFYSNGRQGINYYANTWHLPIIALLPEQSFLIVDRGGSEKNCDEYYFGQQESIRLQPIE